jgi:hypothetical protein
LTPPQIKHKNIPLAIMSLRNEVFQTTTFEASSNVNEPLIAGGDADAEEKDHRLEEKVFSRFKLSSLLLGLLVGFFVHFSTLGGTFLVITMRGEDFVTKCKTYTFVCFSLLCSCFFSAIALVILRFLRNLVAITYSAIGGRSKDLLEEIVAYTECGFIVGTLISISLAGTMAAVHLGMRAQTYVALPVFFCFWCKIVMMYFSANIKPSSYRQSTAEQTTV